MCIRDSYIAAHIKDYIEDGKLFYIFDSENIKKIMKKANFNSNDFINLLDQASTSFDARKLYEYTRKTNVHIDNSQEVTSILQSLKKHMKLKLLDSLIDFLNHENNNESIMAKEIKNHERLIEKLQLKLNNAQNKKEIRKNKIKLLKSQLKEKDALINQLKQAHQQPSMNRTTINNNNSPNLEQFIRNGNFQANSNSRSSYRIPPPPPPPFAVSYAHLTLPTTERV